MAKRLSQTTINHDEIRRWTEQRGGLPTCVVGTGGKGDVGVLRIDFEANGREPNLREISWDEFFQKFEEKNLAFLYQDKTRQGSASRFFKLIRRHGEEVDRPVVQASVRQASHRSGRAVGNDLENQTIQCLNDILEADLKAIEGFEQAFGLVSDDRLREELIRLCDRHEEALLEMESLVYGYGGEPTGLVNSVNSTKASTTESRTQH